VVAVDQETAAPAQEEEVPEAIEPAQSPQFQLIPQSLSPSVPVAAVEKHLPSEVQAEITVFFRQLHQPAAVVVAPLSQTLLA